MPPLRRRPLALLICYGFAGPVGDAMAATVLPPFRVAPELLGPAPQPFRRADPIDAVLGPTPTGRPSAAPTNASASTGQTQAAATTLAAPQAEAAPKPAEPLAATQILPLHRAGGLESIRPQGDEARATFLVADRLSGTTDVETVAEGHAELRRAGTVVTADRFVYRPGEDEVEASGNVTLTEDQNKARVSGPRLKFQVDRKEGFFETPAYAFVRQPKAPMTGPEVEVHGQAERIEFAGENQYRLKGATYTTCKAGREDWYARAASMSLDYDREVGEARDATIVFKDTPILYWPWLSFSLSGQRKSGLLPPTFASGSLSGIDLTLPYYWNIAPNMDATIAPRVMSKRGVQLNGEARYIDYDYAGNARVEWLPEDKVRGKTDRYGYSIVHNQNFGNGFTGVLNLNGVSDDYYYTDLSSRIATTSQTQLQRLAMLSYAGDWGTASARIQRYQTLQPDPANPVAIPYQIMPQLSVNARRSDVFGVDATLFGQYTAFDHPTQVTGKRTVAYPQIALPIESSAWYLTPKIGVHFTRYDLSNQDAATPANQVRSVPILSLDSGVTFERPAEFFGRGYTQTLEPRVYYLYVPPRDQTKIPVFDSAVTDFNFAQVFAENLYTGQDRIADANQVTFAVSSRLLDPGTGGELFKGMVGQRLYFRNQTVTLPGETPRTASSADFLAGVTGEILPRVNLDSAWQFNPHDSRTQRFSAAVRYQPEAGKALNVGYRLTRDTLEQVDISGQWPLFGRWHAVGRYNYSLHDKNLIEAIGGFEYDGGCWVARTVAQRFTSAAGQFSTTLFFQLELNDFARIGSNPLDLLRRTIPGYTRINQTTADPLFGAQ